MTPGRRCAARHRQSGAIGIFAALVLMLALLFTALAVDAGRLWMEKRKLQTVADMAAMEAARNAGCGGNLGYVLPAAQYAAERNGYADNLGNAPNAVETGWIEIDGTLRTFVTRPPAGISGDENAVHVHATKEVPASLILGGLWGSTVRIAADATARAEPPQASFRLGSNLLSISTSNEDATLLNALLSGLLGSTLDLDVLSWKGIANANVNLANLVKISHLGVGSVEKLLDTSLNVAEVLALTAEALTQQAVVDVAAVVGLETLASVAIDNLPIKLGDVLDVAMPASRAAAEASINVLDLITTTLLIANNQSAVDLALGIPGLAGIRLVILEAPRLAVGPPGESSRGDMCTEAKTAQTRLSVVIDPNILGIIKIDLALNVELAPSRANLSSVMLQPGHANVDIDVNPGVVALSLTNSAFNGPAKALELGLLGLEILKAEVGANLPIIAPNAETVNFDVDYPSPTLPETKETEIAVKLSESLQYALSQPDAITVDVSLLGISLGILNDLVRTLLDVLTPILTQVAQLILDPLLKILGVKLGGADVTLEEVQYGRGAELVI